MRSYGARNLAVNIWWAHLTKFNYSDCEQSPHKDKELIPLKLFEFHPDESIRYFTANSSCTSLITCTVHAILVAMACNSSYIEHINVKI